MSTPWYEAGAESLEAGSRLARRAGRWAEREQQRAVRRRLLRAALRSTSRAAVWLDQAASHLESAADLSEETSAPEADLRRAAARLMDLARAAADVLATLQRGPGGGPA